MSNFVNWLTAELESRHWSRSEAARRGGISPSSFDKVINGYSQPGLAFCQGIARAFNMPLEYVFVQAGILPPEPLEDARLTDIVRQISKLPEQDKEGVIHAINALLRLTSHGYT